MSKSIICKGKTSTEAIENGLKELNCKREDVEIKVVEDEEKKAFFSILEPRVVKVELTPKNKSNAIKNNENREYTRKEATEQEYSKCKDNITTFLDSLISKIGDATYNISKKDDMIFVSINGDDASKLIGYRGEVINSIQTLISAIGNKNLETRVRVSLDICGYREKREETLKELASKLEKTIRKTGKKVTLEPMPAYERKIIHTALQNDTDITTYSVGDEPHRRIVIDVKH